MNKLWPEKLKYHEKDGCQNCVTNQNEAINQCRKAVEEAVSVEKLAKRLFDYEFKGRDTWENIDIDLQLRFFREATAIRKQILTELWGGKE